MIHFKPVFISKDQIERTQMVDVTAFVNDGTHRVREVKKIPIDINICEYTKNILNCIGSKRALLLLTDENRNVINMAKIDSNSIKTTVRIDDDLFQALVEYADEAEDSFNEVIRKAEYTITDMGKIYLLPTKEFSHRITIHFSVDEYSLIQGIVHELKKKGLKWVTFSLVVRSILYEFLIVVLDLTRPEGLKALQYVA